MNSPEELVEEIKYLSEEDAIKAAKRALKRKKIGRPKMTVAEKKERKIQREAEKLMGNLKKSIEATAKPRSGGRFISPDPMVNKLKEERKELLTKVDNAAFITEEDRAYFGTDSMKYYERALQSAPTWQEGHIYAKELKNLQHAALSAQQITQEVVVTQKTLKWQWDALEDDSVDIGYLEVKDSDAKE